MFARKRTPFSLKWPSIGFAAGVSVGLAAAIALLVFRSLPPAAATELSHIYAFGDSLTDTGNVFAKTGFPPAPYFEGHFSNGPVWIEYLADDLGVPETDLAYGGARSGEVEALQFGNSPAVQIPGVLTQVNSFVASSPQLDENGLYVIWVGANDYLSGNQRDPSVPVSNIVRAVSTLGNAGATRFLLVNLPALGELPLMHQSQVSPEAAVGLNAIAIEHNRALAEAVSTLNSSGNLKVNLLDVHQLFRAAVAGELANDGLKDTTDACTLEPACVSSPAVQASYLFWDKIHPTTVTHRVIAESAIAAIATQ